MMKKTLTVSEFKKYCEKERFTRIIYHSENQEWYQYADPCKVKMAFPVMEIYENPNILYLKSGKNVLFLDRIQCVKVDTESSVLGTIVAVLCGDFGAKHYDRAYTLIFQK